MLFSRELPARTQEHSQNSMEKLKDVDQGDGNLLLDPPLPNVARYFSISK